MYIPIWLIVVGAVWWALHSWTQHEERERQAYWDRQAGRSWWDDWPTPISGMSSEEFRQKYCRDEEKG